MTTAEGDIAPVLGGRERASSIRNSEWENAASFWDGEAAGDGINNRGGGGGMENEEAMCV